MERCVYSAELLRWPLISDLRGGEMWGWASWRTACAGEHSDWGVARGVAGWDKAGLPHCALRMIESIVNDTMPAGRVSAHNAMPPASRSVYNADQTAQQ
jgi:hypothetical protein